MTDETRRKLAFARTDLIETGWLAGRLAATGWLLFKAAAGLVLLAAGGCAGSAPFSPTGATETPGGHNPAPPRGIALQANAREGTVAEPRRFLPFPCPDAALPERTPFPCVPPPIVVGWTPEPDPEPEPEPEPDPEPEEEPPPPPPSGPPPPPPPPTPTGPPATPGSVRDGESVIARVTRSGASRQVSVTLRNTGTRLGFLGVSLQECVLSRTACERNREDGWVPNTDWKNPGYLEPRSERTFWMRGLWNDSILRVKVFAGISPRTVRCGGNC